IPILLRAIELAERIFFKRGLALATLFLGEAYTEIGDFQRAAEYLARAEILQEQLGEPVRKAGIYYGWSVLKRYQGLYQAAEELARKDLAIVEGLKNKHVIAQALNNLGYALYAGGKLTQAEETWRQAEDCYGDWPSHYELARIKMGLALVCWARLKRGQDDGEGGHSTVPAAVTSEARLPTERNDSEGGGGLTEDKPPVPSSSLAGVSSGQGRIQAENLKQALLEKLKRTLRELFDLIRDHGYGFFLRIPPEDRRLPGDEYIEEVLAAARALDFEPSSGELRTDKPLPARSSTASEARGKALLFAQDRGPTRPGVPSGLTVTAQVADRQNESAGRYPRGPLSGLATRPVAEVQPNDPRVTHLDAASGGITVKSYAAPPLEVYALGRFQVLRGKREITARDWQKEKTKTLLKYLLVNLGRKLPVEVILETLWPAMEPKAARQNLAVIMHYLRRALEPGLARGEESSYCLRHPQSIELKGELIWLDARDFAAKFAAGRKAQQEGKAEEASTLFQEAERLYQGDFLPEEAYEDWAIPERERLREMYLSLLGYLARYCGKSGEYQLGEDYCRRVLQIDPLREEVHRLLIELLARAGRRNEALRQYLSCREILQRELRVEPMPLTRELYQKLVEGKEI
ncbi:MAG: hypothetical protein M1553_13430, partial [Firmicutes bacterium]|nr:hypothetical protein [Bacillota bacterium]